MVRQLDPAARARLMKRFAAIPERMKVAARKEVEAEALAMVEEMQRGAPVDEAVLQESIRAEDQSTDTWIRWRVKAGGPTTTTTIGTQTYDRAVRIGQGSTKGAKKKVGGHRVTYDYALGVEHGTSDTPAQPFFWPTKRRRAKKFRARLRREMAKAAKAE